MTASTPHSMLPALSAEEAAHASARRATDPRTQVAAAGGWLSFERFMELALYAPGLGYYSAGSVKLGAGGDFVTAPEISDLFSRCLARQCAQVLAATGGEILELGAGTGRMAAVILTELAARDELPGALRHPRGERRPRRAPAGASGSAAAGAARARGVARAAARRSRAAA